MSNPTQKLVANLQARAALAGGSVVVTDGDDGRPLFVLSCGALTKQAASVDDLDAAVCAVEQQPLLGKEVRHVAAP